MSSWIAHIDVDAFFATVEQIDNPSLAGKAVIVGGTQNTRSVVSSCSYEARKYGVHSAMPLARAFILCPHAVHCTTRMVRYIEYSKKMLQLLHSFCPIVHAASIDEAYLDFSHTSLLYPNPITLLRYIQNTIYEQLKLRVSIGIGTNWYIAKLASKKEKPNGFHIVPKKQEKLFVHTLALRELWGIGPKTYKKLLKVGIENIETLQKTPESMLIHHMGKSMGTFLFLIANGKAPRKLGTAVKTRSISAEHTFIKNICSLQKAKIILMDLSLSLMCRLKDTQSKGTVLRIKYRLDDFTTFTVQKKYSSIRTTQQIYTGALALLKEKWQEKHPLRLIGITVGNIQKNTSMQEEFFSTPLPRIERLEETIVSLNKKFGNNIIKPAQSIQRKVDK